MAQKKNVQLNQNENLDSKIFRGHLNQNVEQENLQKAKNEELEKLQKQIEELKAENFNIKVLSALEHSGCLKPELVRKAVPDDCENIQDWIDNFKSENDILFKQPQQNHGGNFKPTNCRNLSPSELMNNYIRGI